MNSKKFNILSIDGGGVRGVFPATILANLEAELKSKGVEKWQVYENFDLICGTSTGGILAIGLALGIPASRILDLYLNHAKDIFGKKKSFLKRFFSSAHSRDKLEELIRENFKSVKNGTDPILDDCKTHVCIPIYDLLEGRPAILKSKFCEEYVRDYHIPAYQVALATSAAPTFFDPYRSSYIDTKGVKQNFSNKIDGGVVANNPAMIGIIEAQKAFNIPLAEISVLSIGTGQRKFLDTEVRNGYGLYYWIINGQKRIIEIFMQAQSQHVENQISILKNGPSKREKDNFIYNRINLELESSFRIELDEINQIKLNTLSERAAIKYQENASSIINTYCYPRWSNY